jgi:trimeric autotransporter adhesin
LPSRVKTIIRAAANPAAFSIMGRSINLRKQKGKLMRRVTTSVVAVLFTLLLAILCSAQQVAGTTVPNLIRYSGTLKDTSGSPLVAITGATFAIYKQQEGGAPIWLETQNVTPDANGQYSVLLGNTTAGGVPADLFSQQEQRWLGVQIQGQSEQARVLLVSVPYAFKAHEAETLAGMSVSDFVLAKDLNSSQTSTGTSISSQTGSSSSNGSRVSKPGVKTAADTAGPTNFSGATSDQIVRVTQTGTGNAIFATTSNAGTSNTVVATVNGPGVAIFGQANSAAAQAYGVEGLTSSSIGIGLLGFATASTGSTYGLKGYANSISGTGVRGLATAPSGSTYGVSGAVTSPTGTGLWGQSQASNGGTGVWGQSLATTGPAAGVLASAASSAGIGISTMESSPTGTTYGLNATVQSPSGTAAWLQNTAGGPLLVAATGPSGSPITQFSVDGSGNVNAGGSVNIGTNYRIAGTPVLTVGVPVGSMKNLFVGRFAGANNTGDLNLFVGEDTGYGNTSGAANTFLGVEAGYSNDSGNNNVYVGFQSAIASTGSNNIYLGTAVAYAGYPGDTGNNNTYVGYEAAYNNTSGSNNTYLGYQAGLNNGTGASNIYLGSQGNSGESNVIRIGTQGSAAGQQNAAFIAGIYGTTSASGVPVYVNSNGQLGTLTSSLRFKENVRDMGDSTSALMRLRPVTFFYKPEYEDGPRTMQFGLIAEEVAQVYPELVAHDTDGKPYTVRYQYIVSMLLNEVQKQYHRAEEQAEVVMSQERKINQLEERLSRLEDSVGTQAYHSEGKMMHDGAAGDGARP